MGSDVEYEEKKENLVLRILRVISDSQLAINEYFFIIFITLLEIATPFLGFFCKENVSLIAIVIVTLVVMAFLFILFLDLDEFYQANHVDYLYFQIVIFVLSIVLSLILIGVYRENLLDKLEVITDNFFGVDYNLATSVYVGIWLYVGCVLIVAVSIIFYDVVASLIMLVYAKINHIEINNPYIERIKAAESVESREEYFKKAFQAEYERRAEESVFRPKPLFENTKYFKGITNLEQVRPRYLSLMKQYHPDNAEGTIEICQEIQEEYHEIEKKYNL